MAARRAGQEKHGEDAREALEAARSALEAIPQEEEEEAIP